MALECLCPFVLLIVAMGENAINLLTMFTATTLVTSGLIITLRINKN